MERAIDSTAKALANLGQHVSSNKEQGLSKGFQMLIKMIGEAKTKHEEDRIIKREAVSLKERIGAAEVTPRQMREMLIRLIYCEMLGVECPWGYIHAVKMTQSSNIMDKRIGYLGTSLFLHETHELNMLLVNTLQRDMKSSNMLLVAMALIITCKLIGSEMVPPLLPIVQEKLMHPKELVRKKAVMVMHKFYHLSPSAVDHLEDDFRRCLSDKDPGVMEAALVLFHDMIADNPARFKDLSSSFCSILSQVITRKLSSDFDYHGVPSPWIQIRLLRVMALLGVDDLKTSEKFYPVIEQVLASAECNSNIGQAISYECIRTVSVIYPNSVLIDKAAKTISRFVTASNNNWRYLGITALASLVLINPKYAAEHQGVVIDCLEDPDDTIKRKTLDLLFKMTNPSNVTVIADKLVAYLRVTRDDYTKADLVAKVTQLAERFAPDNLWFIQTMNSVFEIGGSLVRSEVAHNLMRLIAEGTEDEDTDNELRLDAMSAYLELLDKPHLPDILVKIICWVLGEYAYLLEDMDTEAVIEKVTTLLGLKFEESETCGWVVSTLTKLVSQLGHLPDSVQSHIALYLNSTSTDVQQRCTELVELSQDMTLMQEVLPLDASCEDLEVDSSLSFLDTFVSEALAKGASAYKPPQLREPVSPVHQKVSSPSPAIKFEPYAAPQPGAMPTHAHSMATPPPVRSSAPPLTDGIVSGNQSSTMTTSDVATGDSIRIITTDHTHEAVGLSVKQRKWGKEGYNKDIVHVNYETTPTRSDPPAATDHTDSGSKQYDRATSGQSYDKSSGEGLAQVNTVQASIVPPTAEEVKRKQLANQLFGGLSGPSRAPRSRQQRRAAGAQATDSGSRGQSSPGVGSPAKFESVSPRYGKGHHSTPPAPAQPQVDLLLDLQDIDFSSTSSAPPPSTLVPPPTTFSLPQDPPHHPSAATSIPTGSGILANLDVRPPVQATPSAPPTTQTNLLDLLDSSIPPVAATSSTVPVGASATAGDTPPMVAPTPKSDPMSDLSMLGPITNSASSSLTPPTMALSLLDSSVSSIQVPSEYSQYPVSADCENKEACRDVNVRVSLTKVLKADELVLVIHVTNQNQAALPGVTMTIDPPSVMKVKLVSEEKMETSMDLPEFGTVSRVVLLVPSSPAINMSLRGQLSYKDKMATPRRLFFDTSIYISDVIRPMTITTADFGKKWGGLAYEKKLKLPATSVSSVQNFMDMMRAKFNFHPVEIIGTEGICAGTFLPSTTCLVHGKVQKLQLEFWVRSPSSLLTDSLVKLAQATFK